MYYKTLHV